MKKHTGMASSVTLSFDMAFFALVRLALSGEEFSVSKSRCVAHPMRRRAVMRDNDSLCYAARVSAGLVLHKLRDTMADDHGIKKAGAALLLPYAKSMARRGASGTQGMMACISDGLTELSLLEKGRCAVPDQAADCFGRLLGELLAQGLDSPAREIAGEMGLHVGRFVYLADAVLDYDDDRKSGSYNPFLYAFSDASEMAEFRKTTLCGVMASELDGARRAFALADVPEGTLRTVIENIICYGMENAFMTALQRKEASHDKGSV